MIVLINLGRPFPQAFALGDSVAADLPPGITLTYFALQLDSVVQFNVSLNPQAKLVIYGRQTLPPTAAEHDFVEIILGSKLHAKPSTEVVQPAVGIISNGYIGDKVLSPGQFS